MRRIVETPFAAAGSKRVKTRTTTLQLLFYGFVFLYSISIPLPQIVHVDLAIRNLIMQVRSPLILAVLVVFAIFFVLSTARRERFVREPRLRGIFWLGMLFPLFYLATATYKDEISAPVVGLYFCWSLFAFGLVPLALQGQQAYRRVLQLICVTNAGVGVWSIVEATATDTVYLLRDRASYGFQNPNVFVSTLQAAAIAWFLSLATKSRLTRRPVEAMVSWAIVGALTYFAFVAQARNCLLFVAASLTSYAILRKGRKRLALLLVLGGIGVALMIIGSLYFEFSALDDFSSRRLSCWTHVYEEIVSDEYGLSVLFGPPTPPNVSEFLVPYGDVERSFTKFRVDNVFLEHVVEGGIIGLVLFLAPIVAVAKISGRRLGAPEPERRTHVYILCLMVGLAAEGFVVSIVPSFNNPIAFLFVLVAVLPVLGAQQLSNRSKTLVEADDLGARGARSEDRG